MDKIRSLHDEIQQALESTSIRIEAPVPGTKFIGVEVPRTDRVFLKLEKKDMPGNGLIPLGKGIDGVTRFLDLKSSNTPHALVVGRTGSGKSEELKVIIESVKDDFELFLVDPKRTELMGYQAIAKQYCVTPAETEQMLALCNIEMMAVYSQISAKGHKDIDAYNAKIKDPAKRLKHKLICIEEYGQVRLSHLGKAIEHTMLQLCALGRAAGFHIIVSTQRPDITTVSGPLKANIGARICFATASKTDSKVALDEIGAEDLVGKGDMLYRDPGKELQRLQAFYI